MLIFLTSPGGDEDLPPGFTRQTITCAEECITKKQNQGKFHLGFFLGDSFGFAEHQEKATFG